MSVVFDRPAIDRVVRAIADELEGDWLVVGGAAIALWLSPRRTTEDIDVVRVEEAPGARLQLMELASRLGLPVESVNSAADYFVTRLPNWSTQLELMHTGQRGRIFRPSPTLFIRMKLRRLSDQDLADCEVIFSDARANQRPLDAGLLQAELAALPAPADEGISARREKVAALLQS